jgi:hypothetical protein
MDETWLRFMSFPKDDYKDYSLQERDTTYFDRNGMEVIPFALPYQKNYPHIPGIWRDAHFTFDRTRPINTEKGLMRRERRDDRLHYEAAMTEEEFMTFASRRVVA